MTTDKQLNDKTVEIDFGGATDPGVRRSVNEDAFLRIQLKELDLFLLADGMGGPKSGKVASNLVISTIKEFLEKKEVIEVEDIRTAIGEANRILLEKSNSSQELAGMGSTVVALGFLREKLVVLNIGNSRAYAIRGNDISQITVDHTLYQELLASGAIEEQPFLHKPVGHMLTRSLGTSDSVEIDCFIADTNPESGDVYFLCSDGLHDVISPGEMLENCLIYNAEEAARRLIEIGRERGAIDNLTALVVGYKDFGTQVGKEDQPLSSANSNNASAESIQVSPVLVPVNVSESKADEEPHDLDDDHDLDLLLDDDVDLEDDSTLIDESDEEGEDEYLSQFSKSGKEKNEESSALEQDKPFNQSEPIPTFAKDTASTRGTSENLQIYNEQLSEDDSKLFQSNVPKERKTSDKVLGTPNLGSSINKPSGDNSIFVKTRSSLPPLSALIMVALVLGLLVGSFFASGGGGKSVSSKVAINKVSDEPKEVLNTTSLKSDEKVADTNDTETKDKVEIDSEVAALRASQKPEEVQKTLEPKRSIEREKKTSNENIIKVRSRSTNYSDLDLSRLNGDDLEEVHNLIRDVSTVEREDPLLKPSSDYGLRLMFEDVITAIKATFANSRRKIAIISDSNKEIANKLEVLGEKLNLERNGLSETLLQESTP